ncbi:MAG TPA: VOC family protein [Acidimicrobiales bacterium]|nr:VOC family protein [Acidimicrobiales bacterium]
MPPSPPPVADGTSAVLDHVAVAVESWADAWPWYVHRLGGTWHSGGVNIGFSPAQLSYGNGAKVEILQPWEPENNDFLRRFLDHSGPGPHHLTFKVPDIEVALERVQNAGFVPVNVRLSDPQWREAFLHPRQATGVVVQLAQEQFEWISPAPEGFPDPEKPPASLRHVTHAVRALDEGMALFHELLGGVITGRGRGPGETWDFVDLAWPGPLGLRLVAPAAGADSATPLRTWLGDRPGRVHHLAFAWPRSLVSSGSAANDEGAGDGAAVKAGEIPGVLPGPDPVQVVAAGDTLGTGFVLHCPA